MNKEQIDVELAIEEALDGMEPYEQRNYLEGIVNYADNLLDKVKEELEAEENQNEED